MRLPGAGWPAGGAEDPDEGADGSADGVVEAVVDGAGVVEPVAPEVDPLLEPALDPGSVAVLEAPGPAEPSGVGEPLEVGPLTVPDPVDGTDDAGGCLMVELRPTTRLTVVPLWPAPDSGWPSTSSNPVIPPTATRKPAADNASTRRPRPAGRTGRVTTRVLSTSPAWRKEWLSSAAATVVTTEPTAAPASVPATPSVEPAAAAVTEAIAEAPTWVRLSSRRRGAGGAAAGRSSRVPAGGVGSITGRGWVVGMEVHAIRSSGPARSSRCLEGPALRHSPYGSSHLTAGARGPPVVACATSPSSHLAGRGQDGGVDEELLTQDPAVAAEALRRGGLVGLPTETVYGLAADAASAWAVARVFAAKGRPADHPLIVHLTGPGQLDEWAREVPEYARRLARALWPGPLTLVLPRTGRAADQVTGGQDTVGLRCPAHPLAARVIELFGGGVAAPSANRFGRVSPTTAGHVVAELRDQLRPGLDVVLDGGPSGVGVESTILDCTGPRPVLLRPGAVSPEQVAEHGGVPLGTRPSQVRAPGTLASHYAPRARVELVEVEDLAGQAARPGTGLLAPATVATPPGLVRLTAPQDAADYARSLYAALREADALGLARVLAVAPAGGGIAAAVRDRLRRAATPALSDPGPEAAARPAAPAR